MFSAGVRNRCSADVLACVMVLGFAGAAEAQGTKDTNGFGAKGVSAQGTQTDPRPIPEKRRQVKTPLKTELSDTYRKWLDEDVYWIITDEERSAFLQLWNDEERDNFIEVFWQRRLFGHAWLGPWAMQFDVENCSSYRTFLEQRASRTRYTVSDSGKAFEQCNR